MLKSLVTNLLQKKAQRAVARHTPTIVGVTGSVGKTSTRQAIAAALRGSYIVRSPEKNYNNELGLPLTILGEHSPGKSVAGWLRVLFAKQRGEFPQALVLEYGIDHPGDMARLVDIARPNIAVITAVSSVHAANFPDFSALVNEKAALALAVRDGAVVLNADDDKVREMKLRLKVPVVTYGFTPDADVHVVAHRTVISSTSIMTEAEVALGGERVTLRLENCLGRAMVSSALAALAVGRLLGVAPHVVAGRLAGNLTPVPGRMNPLPGIKGSRILDDSYNAAPASMRAALETLALFDQAPRRIAALGKMAELGQYGEEEHRKIGARVAEVADMYIAVGEETKPAVQAARAAGLAEGTVHWFATSTEAGRFLDAEVRQGDVVLVKGSQSARMERVVKDIMAEPLRAAELLVRQDGKWLA